MASVERTAYPRFKRTIASCELPEAFAPGPSEVAWAQGKARSPDTRKRPLYVRFQPIHTGGEFDGVCLTLAADGARPWPGIVRYAQLHTE